MVSYPKKEAAAQPEKEKSRAGRPASSDTQFTEDLASLGLIQEHYINDEVTSQNNWSYSSKHDNTAWINAPGYPGGTAKLVSVPKITRNYGMVAPAEGQVLVPIDKIQRTRVLGSKNKVLFMSCTTSAALSCSRCNSCQPQIHPTHMQCIQDSNTFSGSANRRVLSAPFARV